MHTTRRYSAQILGYATNKLLTVFAKEQVLHGYPYVSDVLPVTETSYREKQGRVFKDVVEA